MFYDACDCPLPATSTQSVEAWDAMVRAFLAHGTQTPVHLGRLLELDPEFGLAHAAKGLFSLMMGRRELVEVAASALKDAKRFQTGTDLRETAYIEALAAWLAGYPTQAIAHIERVISAHPTDTLSVKISQGIRFILGDSNGMRSSVEAVLAAHEDHPLQGYVLGCHAFTLEETGDYAAAERTGLLGLTKTDDDAWGLHAVAHVYDMTGQTDAGISLIEDRPLAWNRSNNFRYHVWWHKALLHLDKGQADLVLSIYDAEIRAEKTDDYRDIANATSLLMRLELDGMDVGHRWNELAELSENRTDDDCVVFADLHYMLALTGDTRTDAAQRLRRRIAASAGETDMGQVSADPGVAASAGLTEFAEGNYQTAFKHLAAARATMQSIGGSHAQRDVFERITVEAGLRAGYTTQTAAILKQRSDLRGGAVDRFAATRLAQLDAMTRIPAQ
jgi:tetratricopeptide (TPR) repeat protein